MKKTSVLLCLGSVLVAATSNAVDLKQSKVTQVVNDVQIISAADQKQKNATVNDVFSMPDILRTGAASRAELVAADETVTRVGANTIFSFDPANRTIDLKQGSLLFHAPHGKGGGTIHTGSATASVLGTTLIVVSTPNGGFKVIDLEGEVEVHFLHGLKQKLDPGQMTFILPGANQLAPIVVFRLDELTMNSLLVKGFQQPLDSLPLIQNQIDKQLKQIYLGKITDTGLYVGSDATANQVEVLDINTISHSQPQPPKSSSSPSPASPPPTFDLAAAENSDATINQSSLTDASIPTPPLHLNNSPFLLTGNSYFSGQSFSGFIARNIFVNTLGSAGLLVDLSPYRGLSTFDMIALHNFSFEGSEVFNGLSSQQNLALFAGGQFSFAPGNSVVANVNEFSLSSPADLVFDGVGLYNDVNAITLNSGGSGSVLGGSVFNANGALNFNVGNDITVANSSLTAGVALLTALNGSIEFDNSMLIANSHVVFVAPSAINLNNSTINSDAVTLNGSGSASISINNSTINAPSLITALAPNAVNVTGSTLNSDPAAGAVSLISTLGSVTVSGSTISAQNLNVSAGDSIYFDGGNSVSGGGGGAIGNARYLTLASGDGILLNAKGARTTFAAEIVPTANFTAVNTTDVRNADLTSYALVNMSANTINLYNVAFSGTVNLNSLYGVWHNGSSVYGDVNDLGGVTYNGVTVSAENGFSGTIPGTSITVGPLFNSFPQLRGR